jgi:hypothetical protein
MEKITFEYQPFLFLKYRRKIKGAFPSTFTELTPKQFLAVVKLTNGRISETGFLQIMTGIPKFYIKRSSSFDRYNLMELFAPFTEIKPHSHFIIPEISHYSSIFCSPKYRLAQVSFGQFIFIESYFTDYQNDEKNTLALHKFVASLYLIKNQPFSQQEIAANAAIISKVKPEILQAIVLNYVLVKKWLAESYPMLFQQDDEPDDDTEAPIKKHRKPANSQWLKIFENVVGDDLVNHDRYALLPIHTVLRWMTMRIVDNMKRK